MKMIGNGWHILDTEMRIENGVVKGKIDYVFKGRDIACIRIGVTSRTKGSIVTNHQMVSPTINTTKASEEKARLGQLDIVS